jgi:tripartite-type tricarboxylate transporter receptor subunit TctC
MRAWLRLMTLAALAAVYMTTPAAAQSYPTKPIKIIVTFAPGGSSDIVARLIGPPLADKLGQPVIIDNRPGGGATIGGAAVAQAPADGYTLMLSNTAPISISPFMLDKPTYDPVKSFTHISYIGSVPNVFVVNPSVPAKNYAELVAWLKKQPNAVGYGSGGVGSIGHIVGEVMKQEAGVKMEHVPYKGSSPMHTDLLGGQILFAIDTLPQNVPYINTGKLRGIAVTSRTRMALAPDLPTVIEIGQPKLLAENFFGLSGPAGLPKPIVDRLNTAMNEVLAMPDVQKKLEDFGVALRRMSTAEFQDFVAKQVADWAPAVKASGATLN